VLRRAEGVMRLADFIGIGCDDWHRWSSLAPVNYVLYILFAVCSPQTFLWA